MFDSALWGLMQNRASRNQLREALVARYFPDQRPKIQSLFTAPEPPRGLELNKEFEQARSGAFRQTVLEVYDYTCAACGLRVRLNDGFSLVEVAHLIPFNVTRDDNPNNGLALCPNHHRAMDRFLIAPCPDTKHGAGIWRVGPALDPRIEGQKALVALDGQRVIAPAEEKFYPAIASLRWRANKSAGGFEYISIRWAGKENTHIIRPGGQVEFIGAELRKLPKPDRDDDRAFYMNLAMNGPNKEGFEFAGMSSDEIVMRRSLSH